MKIKSVFYILIIILCLIVMTCTMELINPFKESTYTDPTIESTPGETIDPTPESTPESTPEPTPEPTPTRITIPRTGQTTSYAEGDDGYYQAGAAWPEPRFNDNDDNTVTDNLTGLMWEQKPGSGNDGAGTASTMVWTDSITYCEDLQLADYLDWRLPNINELLSLVNLQETSQSTWLESQGFSTINFGYWSSTTFTPSTDNAHHLTSSGRTYGSDKAGANYVWAVRGVASSTIVLPITGQITSYAAGDDGYYQAGSPWPEPRFTAYGSGNAMIDNLTGLMWETAPSSTTDRWADVVLNAGSLDMEGHTDWRLPNRNELYSLVNQELSSQRTWLNSQGFTIPVSDFFWSGTTCAASTTDAWALNITNSNMMIEAKNSKYYVWRVRDGLVVTPTPESTPDPTPEPTPAGNLVLNPDFELDKTDWSDWDNTSIVADPASGDYAAQIGTGEGGMGQIIPGCSEATAYTLYGWGKVSALTEIAYLGVDCLDSIGTKLAGGKFEILLHNTSYSNQTLTFTTITGTEQLQVFIWKNADAGGYAYIDNISLILAPAPTPSVPPAENLILNPDFESGSVDWEDWGNTSIVTDPANGIYAARIGTIHGGMGQVISDCSAAAQYTLSGWGKVSAVTEYGYLGVDCLDSVGTSLPGGYFEIVFRTTTYTEQTLTFTTVADTSQLEVYIWKDTDDDTYVFIDNISLTGP